MPGANEDSHTLKAGKLQRVESGGSTSSAMAIRDDLALRPKTGGSGKVSDVIRATVTPVGDQVFPEKELGVRDAAGTVTARVDEGSFKLCSPSHVKQVRIFIAVQDLLRRSN